MVALNSPLPADEPARPARSDGQLARERLLGEALRLFSEQGFARTSTRAIAQAAGANISAISYYFGDKQGLYRCAFLEPMSSSNVQEQIDGWNDPGLSLEQALHRFYSGMPIHLMATPDMVQIISPALQQGPSPVGRAVAHLVRYALALIHDEARQRGLPSPVSGVDP